MPAETEERVENTHWDRRNSWEYALRQKKELIMRAETEERVEHARWDRRKSSACALR